MTWIEDEDDLLVSWGHEIIGEKIVEFPPPLAKIPLILRQEEEVVDNLMLNIANCYRLSIDYVVYMLSPFNVGSFIGQLWTSPLI